MQFDLIFLLIAFLVLFFLGRHLGRQNNLFCNIHVISLGLMKNLLLFVFINFLLYIYILVLNQVIIQMTDLEIEFLILEEVAKPEVNHIINEKSPTPTPNKFFDYYSPLLYQYDLYILTSRLDRFSQYYEIGDYSIGIDYSMSVNNNRYYDDEDLEEIEELATASKSLLVEPMEEILAKASSKPVLPYFISEEFIRSNLEPMIQQIKYPFYNLEAYTNMELINEYTSIINRVTIFLQSNPQFSNVNKQLGIYEILKDNIFWNYCSEERYRNILLSILNDVSLSNNEIAKKTCNYLYTFCSFINMSPELRDVIINSDTKFNDVMAYIIKNK